MAFFAHPCWQQSESQSQQKYTSSRQFSTSAIQLPWQETPVDLKGSITEPIISTMAASESEMCVQAVLELVAQDSDLKNVLDLGACKGDIGQSLAEHGLTNIFGHEGSENKK